MPSDYRNPCEDDGYSGGRQIKSCLSFAKRGAKTAAVLRKPRPTIEAAPTTLNAALDFTGVTSELEVHPIIGSLWFIL